MNCWVVVGAAGLGRLLAESLAVFGFPVVTTLLATSFVLAQPPNSSAAATIGGFTFQAVTVT